MFDLVIKEGLIYDGLGNEPIKTDIGISGDRICQIGSIEDSHAREVLNVSGDVVSPGFIDFHSHADFALINQPESFAKVLQGVTTEVIGNCGFSPAPSSPATLNLLQKYLLPTLGKTESWNWSTFSEYLGALSAARPSVNFATFVGHGALRIYAMGFSSNKPDSHQMSLMKEALIASLDAGVVGLSTGLIYVPACYSGQEELEEFCRILARYNRIFAIHMRNESDMLLESVKENIELARKTGVHLHISHLKASGSANWNQIDLVLELIESARNEGIKVTCDQYPYTAGSTTINVLFPQWVVEGGIVAMLDRLKDKGIRERIKQDFSTGIPEWDCLVRANGWDNIMLNYVGSESCKGFEGLTLKDVAKKLGKDPAEALFDLVIEIQGEASIVVFQQSEENVIKAMKKDYVVVGSDGLHSGVKPHPRLFGTFPRVLSRYVRELKSISLSKAIMKMTSLSADIIGQPLLGRIKEGCYADLTIFNPELIEDTACFEDSARHPKGIQAVIVNGVPVVTNGKHTLARTGRAVLYQKNNRG